MYWSGTLSFERKTPNWVKIIPNIEIQRKSIVAVMPVATENVTDTVTPLYSYRENVGIPISIYTQRINRICVGRLGRCENHSDHKNQCLSQSVCWEHIYTEKWQIFRGDAVSSLNKGKLFSIATTSVMCWWWWLHVCFSTNARHSSQTLWAIPSLFSFNRNCLIMDKTRWNIWKRRIIFCICAEARIEARHEMFVLLYLLSFVSL